MFGTVRTVFYKLLFKVIYENKYPVSVHRHRAKAVSF